ncbi:MAG TPA: 7TM diverse intracellular signaling domain-containing protein [Chitinophagaceae bacterium]
MNFALSALKLSCRFFLLWLLLQTPLASIASPVPPLIDVAKIRIAENLEKQVLYFTDSLHRLAPSQLPTALFTPDMPRNIFRQLTPEQVQKDWYLQFRLQNTADSAISVYFFPGVFFTGIDLYRYNDSTRQVEALPRLLPRIPDSIGYRKIILPAHSSGVYYAALKFVKTSVDVVDPRIIRDFTMGYFPKNYRLPSTNSNMYTYIIVGILTMMIFYSLAVFLLNGTLEFLYNSCYAFFMGLLFFLNAYFYKATVPFNYFFQSYLDFMIQCLGMFFYLVFVRKFINARKNFPLLHHLLVIGQIVIVVCIIVFSWVNFRSDNFVLQDMIENMTKYEWWLTTIVFIVYAVIHKNQLLTWLAVGHFFLLLTGMLSLIFIRYPALIGNSIWRDSLFYYELGLTIELFFFLIALAFKNRRDLVERTRERERLKLENERKEFEKQLAIVEARQEERNRISTDMHDELGSGVTAIRLMSEIVKTKMKGNTLPEIDKISNSANDLLSKMNTIIWTMASSNDKVDNMVAYIRSYALEFFESTQIDCHFMDAGDIPSSEISGEKRRSLFLCIKEALNNVVKHSKATDVWIQVSVAPGLLEIKITDNGAGINMAKLREFGNGLNNMKKRMATINGTFSIENRDGTIATFVTPLG